MLAEVIKQGAGFTGDYLLYTADVANELKKRYFIKAQQILIKCGRFKAKGEVSRCSY